MDTASRMLRLLTLLQSRPHWSGSDLAERLGVTTRTLRRDAARLRELGYPIDADPGVAGGYRFGVAGRLPPLLLDDDEAVAIAVGLRVATRTTVEGVEESVVAALAKLDAVLPARLRERVAAVHESTVQMPIPELPRIDTDVLLTLATGCRRGEGVRFSYTDNAGRSSSRHAEPLRVVHTGRRWYFVARDRDRDAWRTFRVDRISSPSLTGQRYTHDDPPDPVALVSEGTGYAPYSIKAEVLVDASPALVSKALPPGVAVVEPHSTPDHAIVRIAADDLLPLVDFVCRLPWPFEVRSPESLRDALRDLAGRILDRHPAP